MYQVKVYELKNEWVVEFERVRVSFETEKQANKFVIELLKETGRIGY